jgi:hypothetical protein
MMTRRQSPLQHWQLLKASSGLTLGFLCYVGHMRPTYVLMRVEKLCGASIDPQNIQEILAENKINEKGLCQRRLFLS